MLPIWRFLIQKCTYRHTHTYAYTLKQTPHISLLFQLDDFISFHNNTQFPIAWNGKHIFSGVLLAITYSSPSGQMPVVSSYFVQ